MTEFDSRTHFWREAFTFRGAATLRVLGACAIFVAWSALFSYIHWKDGLPDLDIDVGPYEVAGGVLGVLMVLRTNAGYERWWEGRKLWGGINNQLRNLAIIGLAYGKDDAAWRDRLVRRAAAFAHVCRRSLRGERDMPEVADLLGTDEAFRLSTSKHMPTALSRLIADDLRYGLEGFAFQQAESQRGLLIDHIGACERIAQTPLPAAYSIEIRHFIVLLLLTLPFALFNKIGKDKVLWLVPLVEFLAAYPVLVLDEIGSELQHPFSKRRVNHLPLDEVTRAIEENLLANLDSASETTRVDVSGHRPTKSKSVD